MRSVAVLTTIITLSAASAAAQQTGIAWRPGSAQLEVAVRGYGADGTARSMAGDSTAEKMDGYVWADKSLCVMGSGNAAPATTPWVGWHFTATVENGTKDVARDAFAKLHARAGAVAFRIEWQRIWDNGAKLAEGKKGASTSSLRDGERLELDQVTGTPTASCPTAQARLEVGAVAGNAYRLGFFKNSPEWAAAGGDFGSNTWVVKRGDLATTYQAFADGLKTFDAKAWGVLMPSSYDAELWLVHRKPDGTETTQRQTVRFTGTDQTFTFPAISVATSKGNISLDVSGSVRAVVGPDPEGRAPFFFRNNDTGWAYRDRLVSATANAATAAKAAKAGGAGAAANAAATGTTDDAIRLAVSISRRARASSTPPLDTRGGSFFFMDLPESADVVSFEFPALQKATEDLLKGHTFSLRIRVTPVAK